MTERDCLWAIPNNKFGLARYDLKTGKAEKLDVEVPEALKKFRYWRETVVMPGANLILVMSRLEAPDGKMKSIALDVKRRKYVWLDLPVP